MTRFTAPIAEQIWDMKYRFKDADGQPNDKTVEDTWKRIAGALAEVEDKPKVWEEKFYGALEDFKYLPAGRITAGAGTASVIATAYYSVLVGITAYVLVASGGSSDRQVQYGYTH